MTIVSSAPLVTLPCHRVNSFETNSIEVNKAVANGWNIVIGVKVRRYPIRRVTIAAGAAAVRMHNFKRRGGHGMDGKFSCERSAWKQNVYYV